jgi:hemoglobin
MQATAKLEEADVETQPTSLYDRLGGIYNIATVVDDFIDRIMVDDRLNANPRVDEAHHRVLPPGFKYLVTEQLAEASGGPQRYSGRSMEESHREMRITAEEWEAFVDDLNQSLDKFEVPQQERSEVLAIIESTRDDIVVGESLRRS